MGEDEGVEQKGRGTQARARLKEATGSPIQRLAPSASPSVAATGRDSLWAAVAPGHLQRAVQQVRFGSDERPVRRSARV